jgi:hypothetical protein
MHQLKDIQGSGQILQLLKHLHIQSPFQKMWLIALHWAQLLSGFHTPLLQDPTVPAPHMEGLNITSLREFLASISRSMAGGKHIDSSFLALDPLLLSSTSTLIEPLQDQPQTASALATCKLSLVQYSYWRFTPTIGKMVGSRSTAQEELPFYFDPDTKTLLSRTGEGFSIHSHMQLEEYKISFADKSTIINTPIEFLPC